MLSLVGERIIAPLRRMWHTDYWEKKYVVSSPLLYVLSCSVLVNLFSLSLSVSPFSAISLSLPFLLFLHHKLHGLDCKSVPQPQSYFTAASHSILPQPAYSPFTSRLIAQTINSSLYPHSPSMPLCNLSFYGMVWYHKWALPRPKCLCST